MSRMLMIVVLSVVLAPAMLAQNKYVGVKFCGTCHKSGKGGTSFAVWEKSAHANAFKTLKSEKAQKIAEEKGISGPAYEAEACLKCHVTGGGTAKNIDKGFKLEEGVTCEACHGAASKYKITHSKGDTEKAIAAGLIEGDETGESCLTCHNEESPTYKEFKFEERWKKIAHDLPEKK